MKVDIDSVRPIPTDDEAAAIVAFIEFAWPKPHPVTLTERETPAWRFSGRWWAKPVAARRDRPWF